MSNEYKLEYKRFTDTVVMKMFTASAKLGKRGSLLKPLKSTRMDERITESVVVAVQDSSYVPNEKEKIPHSKAGADIKSYML